MIGDGRKFDFLLEEFAQQRRVSFDGHGEEDEEENKTRPDFLHINDNRPVLSDGQPAKEKGQRRVGREGTDVICQEPVSSTLCSFHAIIGLGRGPSPHMSLVYSLLSHGSEHGTQVERNGRATTSSERPL